MKLQTLLGVAQALSVLNTSKIPVKAGFRIAKAINLVNAEIKTYDEQRLKLAQELGTLTEDGRNYQFLGDNGVIFTTQLNELLDEEVDLSLPSITIDELGENFSIEPQHLAALMDINLITQPAPPSP